MEKLLAAWKVCALASVTILAVSLAVLTFQLSASVDKVRSDTANVFGKLNDTLDHLNKPCKGSGADKADNCGTLALAGQTMVNAGDLIKQSQLVEIRESDFLQVAMPQLVRDTHAALLNVGTATADLHPLLTSTTARMDALGPLETNATNTLATFNTGSASLFLKAGTTMDTTNAFIANPHFVSLLGHADGISGSMDSILARGYLVEAKATQCYLYPTFKCKLAEIAIPAMSFAGPLVQAVK